MKIANLATMWFAVGFARAIAPAHTVRSCIIGLHVKNADWADLDTGYLSGRGPMPVPRAHGTLKM